MASEDDVIRVGMEGDPSAYVAGLEKMVAETKLKLGQLTAQFSDSTAKVAIAVSALNNAVSSMNQQYGEGAAKLPRFTTITKLYTEAVVEANAQSNTLKESVAETTEELAKQSRQLEGARSLLRSHLAQQNEAARAPDEVAAPPTAAPKVAPTARPTPVQVTPPADVVILGKAQLDAIESANMMFNRQAKMVESLSKEVAASVGASSQEMAGLYVRATSEMGLASSTLIKAQRALGPAAAAGSEQATEALEVLELSYNNIKAVVDGLKNQIKGLTETEMANAEASNAVSSATMKSAEAMDLLQRQARTLVAISTESNQASLTSVEVQSLYQRAMVESRQALAGLVSAQKELGPAAAEGDLVATEAIQAFQAAYQRATLVVEGLREQVRQLSAADQTYTSEQTQATQAQNRLVEAQELSTRQEQILLSITRDSTEGTQTAASVQGQYKRALTESQIASKALSTAQKELGPAAVAGVADAVEAIRILEANYVRAIDTVIALKAQVKSLTMGPVAAPQESIDVTAATQQTAAKQLLERQERTLLTIRQEADAETVTSITLENLRQRAVTESRLAVSGLATAQKEIGLAAASGNATAIEAISLFEQANTNASSTVTALKERITQLTQAQGSEAESSVRAVAAADQLAGAQALVARQTQTLAALQQELGVSTNLSLGQMQALYRRAGAELSTVASALASAQKEIGLSAAAGVAEASEALAILQGGYADAAAMAEVLKAKVAELSSVQQSSAQSSDTEATASQQLAAALALASQQSASLSAIQKELDGNVKLTSQELGSVYVRAATEARTASQALIKAQNDLRAAVVAGNADAIRAIQVLSQNNQQAASYAALLKTQTNELATAQEASAKAAMMEGAAQDTATQAKLAGAAAALKEAGAQEKLTYDTYASFSASQALASETGLGGIGYSISRITSQSKILGPVFEAALPLALVGAGIDLLATMAEGVKKVWENYIELKDAVDNAAAAEEHLNKIIEQSNAKSEQDVLDHMRRVGMQVEAAQRNRKDKDTEPVEMKAVLSDKQIDTQFKDLPTKLRDKMKDAFQNTTTGELIKRIREVEVEYKQTAAAAAELRKQQQDLTNAPVGPYGPSTGLAKDELEHEAKQQEVAAAVMKKALDAMNARVVQYSRDVGKSMDEVDDSRARKLIETAQLQVDTLKQTGKDSKAAEDEIWRGVLQQLTVGTSEYKEVMNKLASVDSKHTPPDKTAQEMRKVDQDTLTEMKLYAEEVGESQSELLSKEETFVRSRLAVEQKYRDNMRMLRRDLLDVKKGQETEQIHGDDAGAKPMVTDEGKHDYQGQTEYWNNIASQAEVGSKRWVNAIQHAKQDGGEAIRQLNDDIKKSVTQEFEGWDREGRHTETEVIHFWEAIKTKYAASAPVVEEALKHITDALVKYREEQEKVQVIGLTTKHEATEDNFSQREETIKSNYEVGGQTGPDKKRELTELMALHAEELQEQIRFLAEMAQLEATHGDDKAALKDYEKILSAQRNYHKQRVQDETRLVQEIQQPYRKMFNFIEQEMNSAVRQMMSGQKTFGEAMATMWDNLIMKVGEGIANMVMQWVAGELLMTVAHTTANEVRVASDASATAQSTAIHEAGNLKQKMSDAKVAAAEAFKAVVGIPLIGPVLAPVAAAGAFAAVAAFEQGGIVPNTGMALVHGGEMVLPQAISQKVQQSVTQASTISNTNVNNQLGSGMDTGLLQQIATNTANTATALGYNSSQKVLQAQQDQQNQGIGGEIKSGLKQDFMNMIGLPNRDLNNLSVQQLLAKIADNTSTLKQGFGSKGIGLIAGLFGFKQGGVVPGLPDVAFPAVLHGGEMVLPHHLSVGVQQMIQHGGAPPRMGGPSSINNNFNMKYGPHMASQGPRQDTRAMMSEMRRAARSFNNS